MNTRRCLGNACAVTVVAIAGLFSASRTNAQPASPDLASLRQALSDRLTQSGLGGQIGIAVSDAATGTSVFSHRSSVPMNPASNQKLLTAAAALEELGPEFTMLTGCYGEIQPDGSVPTLVLRGFGDPMLRFADLIELAVELEHRGVRRIGELVVDGSYFDERALPPAFEQQPNEIAPFRAPVSAVAVERNAYALTLRPGAMDGAPGIVELDGASHFVVTNQLVTSSAAAPIIAVQRVAGEKLALTVRGSLAAGSRPVTFRRRIENPLSYAGHLMLDALTRVGIRHSERVRILQRASNVNFPLLASHRSPPLAVVLRELGKDSDNFVAEMILKVLGAEKKGRPARSENGVVVVQEYLTRIGAWQQGMVLVNGSGLFRGNAVTADAFVRVLRDVLGNPNVSSDYIAHLAIGGVDGTLEHRFHGVPHARAVRAKTGTLANVAALSGYVLGPSGRSFVFSFMANDPPGGIGAARQLVDSMVADMLLALYPAGGD